MIQNDAFQMHSSRYGGCFQILSSDGTFLTAKKGLLPPKYDFAIDLTCDDSKTKYSSPVRAYYEIASLSFGAVHKLRHAKGGGGGLNNCDGL